MEKENKGFWYYFEKWHHLAKGKDPLRWEGSRMANTWCEECQFCCGKQDSADEPFPMALLPKQIGPETATDFYMLNANTAALGAQGCKSLTSHGCRLPYEKRPVACGLFPIVLVNGALFLYQICPAAIFLPLAHFYQLAKEVALYLDKFSLADLKHISINLSDEVIMQKYINLHVRMFRAKDKEVSFN